MRVENDRVIFTNKGNKIDISSGRRSLSGYGGGGYGGYAYPAWYSDLPNAVPYTCSNWTASDGTTTYPCENVGMHSFLSLSDLGFSDSANDSWGVSVGGQDYVAIGSCSAMAVVRVTDPNNPIVMGNIAFSSDSSIAYSGSSIFGNNMWADFKSIGNNMYFVNQRQNSHIFKINMASMNNHSVGNTLPSTNFAPSNYTGSHNLQAFGGNLYTFYNSGSLGWYDCAAYDFGVMIHSQSGGSVGCIARSAGGDMHDAAFHQYGSTKVGFFAAGQEYSTHGCSMWNVSNAGSPSFIADVPFPSQGQYSHQPALNANGSFMIVTDEWDEMGMDGAPGQTGGKIRLRSWNVSASGSSNAQTVTTTIVGNEHQGYIHDDYYFLAALNSGFHIFDVTATAIGSRAGYFDTHNGGNWGFSGAWSVFVFPYTACNPFGNTGGGNTYYKVAISDRAGLFMLAPDFHTGSATQCAGVFYTYGSGSGSGK